MDELMGAATEDKQPTNKEQQITSNKSVFSKKIAISLCVIAIFICAVAWIVFSVNKNQENGEELPINIGELDSYDISDLYQEEDEVIKEK